MSWQGVAAHVMGHAHLAGGITESRAQQPLRPIGVYRLHHYYRPRCENLTH